MDASMPSPRPPEARVGARRQVISNRSLTAAPPADTSATPRDPTGTVHVFVAPPLRVGEFDSP